jgi:hypothetical protein
METIINIRYPALKENQAICFLNKNKTPRPAEIDGGYYGITFLFSSIPDASTHKSDFDRKGGIATLNLINPHDKILCLFLEFEPSFNADNSTINHYFVGEYAYGTNINHDIKIIHEHIWPKPSSCKILSANFIPLI